jgi:hypothetical protein
MTKHISEGLVSAVLPLGALCCNNDNLRAAALSAPPVVEVTPAIQREL